MKQKLMPSILLILLISLTLGFTTTIISSTSRTLKQWKKQELNDNASQAQYVHESFNIVPNLVDARTIRNENWDFVFGDSTSNVPIYYFEDDQTKLDLFEIYEDPTSNTNRNEKFLIDVVSDNTVTIWWHYLTNGYNYFDSTNIISRNEFSIYWLEQFLKYGGNFQAYIIDKLINQIDNSNLGVDPIYQYSKVFQYNKSESPFSDGESVDQTYWIKPFSNDEVLNTLEEDEDDFGISIENNGSTSKTISIDVKVNEKYLSANELDDNNLPNKLVIDIEPWFATKLNNAFSLIKGVGLINQSQYNSLIFDIPDLTTKTMLTIEFHVIGTSLSIDTIIPSSVYRESLDTHIYNSKIDTPVYMPYHSYAYLQLLAFTYFSGISNIVDYTGYLYDQTYYDAQYKKYSLFDYGASGHYHNFATKESIQKIENKNLSREKFYRKNNRKLEEQFSNILWNIINYDVSQNKGKTGCLGSTNETCLFVPWTNNATSINESFQFVGGRYLGGNSQDSLSGVPTYLHMFNFATYGLLIVLLSINIVLIVLILGKNIKNESRSIGIYKSLGKSKYEINVAYMTQSIIIVISGIIGGILIGRLLASFVILPLFAQYFGFSISLIAISKPFLLIVLLIPFSIVVSTILIVSNNHIKKDVLTLINEVDKVKPNVFIRSSNKVFAAKNRSFKLNYSTHTMLRTLTSSIVLFFIIFVISVFTLVTMSSSNSVNKTTRKLIENYNSNQIVTFDEIRTQDIIDLNTLGTDPLDYVAPLEQTYTFGYPYSVNDQPDNEITSVYYTVCDSNGDYIPNSPDIYGDFRESDESAINVETNPGLEDYIFETSFDTHWYVPLNVMNQFLYDFDMSRSNAQCSESGWDDFENDANWVYTFFYTFTDLFDLSTRLYGANYSTINHLVSSKNSNYVKQFTISDPNHSSSNSSTLTVDYVNQKTLNENYSFVKEQDKLINETLSKNKECISSLNNDRALMINNGVVVAQEKSCVTVPIIVSKQVYDDFSLSGGYSVSLSKFGDNSNLKYLKEPYEQFKSEWEEDNSNFSLSIGIEINFVPVATFNEISSTEVIAYNPFGDTRFQEIDFVKECSEIIYSVDCTDLNQNTNATSFLQAIIDPSTFTLRYDTSNENEELFVPSIIWSSKENVSTLSDYPIYINTDGITEVNYAGLTNYMDEDTISIALEYVSNQLPNIGVFLIKFYIFALIIVLALLAYFDISNSISKDAILLKSMGYKNFELIKMMLLPYIPIVAISFVAGVFTSWILLLWMQSYVYSITFTTLVFTPNILGVAIVFALISLIFVLTLVAINFININKIQPAIDLAKE